MYSYCFRYKLSQILRQLKSEKQKRFKLCIYDYSICLFYSVLITFYRLYFNLQRYEKYPNHPQENEQLAKV